VEGLEVFGVKNKLMLIDMAGASFEWYSAIRITFIETINIKARRCPIAIK
jgi:hypothetical protein